MTTPKNVKDFANNIDFLMDELNASGFKATDVYSLSQDKCFCKSGNFLNIISHPSDFLSILFPNFSKSEIRQLVSFLFFAHHVISGNQINQKESMLFAVSKGNQGFVIFSKIFFLNVNNGVLAIRGECFNKSFVKPLDIEFHDIMYTLKKSFKNNITFYFEDMLEINTALINKMLIESVSDYFWRKNNSNVLIHLSDDDFINHFIELGQANVVDNKAPSLQLMHDNDVINLKELNNISYVDGIKSDMETATNFIFKFKYQDLRHTRSFFEKTMAVKSVDKIFQIIDLFVFKQKIHGLFRDSDLIQVFRSNCKKHQKNSLPYLTGLCIQICGLSINFTDRITVTDDICNGIDKITSDDFDYVERIYKCSFIQDIEKKFAMSAKDITNKSLLVYQMAII